MSPPKVIHPYKMQVVSNVSVGDLIITLNMIILYLPIIKRINYFHVSTPDLLNSDRVEEKNSYWKLAMCPCSAYRQHCSHNDKVTNLLLLWNNKYAVICGQNCICMKNICQIHLFSVQDSQRSPWTKIGMLSKMLSQFSLSLCFFKHFNCNFPSKPVPEKVLNLVICLQWVYNLTVST